MKCSECGSENIKIDKKFDNFYICKDCGNMVWDYNGEMTYSAVIDYICLNGIYDYKNEKYQNEIDKANGLKK